jgi:hypothetical protein
MPTVGTDCDLIIDGKGYIMDAGSYQEFPVQPHVVRVATAGVEPRYDDLTGLQHIEVGWAGGYGHRYGDPSQFLYSSGVETRYADYVALAPWFRQLPSNPEYEAGGWAEYGGAVYSGNGKRVWLDRGMAHYDYFDRAASATVLGSTTSGAAWTAVAGTWGVTDGQAYCVTAGAGNLAQFDSGLADGVIYTHVTWKTGAGAWVVARYADADNYIKMGINTAGDIQIIKRVAGVETTLYTGTAGCVDGGVYQLGGAFMATSLVMWLLDGTTYIVGGGATDGAGSANTRVGLLNGAAVAGVRWDNFLVRYYPALSKVLTAGTVVSDLCVYKANLYAACGAAEDVWRYSGAAWSQPAAGEKANYFCVWDDKLLKIYNASGTNTIKWSTDGVTWTEIATIEDRGTPTTMTTWLDRAGDPAVYVGLTTGLWVLDFVAGQCYQVLDFHQASGAYNCRGMKEWHGDLYVPWRGRLLKLTGAAVVDIGPEDVDMPADRLGWVTDLAPSPRYLYVAYRTRDVAKFRSAILVYDGQAWHNLLWTEPDATTTDLHSTILSLYFDSNETLHWTQVSLSNLDGHFYVAIMYDPPSHYSRHVFEDSPGTLITSWIDCGKSRVDKSWFDLMCESADITGSSATSERIEVWYQTNDNADDSDLDASWTSLGTFDASPSDTLSFNGVYSRNIRFRFRFKGGPNLGKSPKARAFVLRYDVVPDERMASSFTVRIEDQPVGVDNREDTRQGETIWSDLSASLAKKVPISFTNPFGTVRTVRSQTRGLRLVVHTEDGETVGKAQVLLHEVK